MYPSSALSTAGDISFGSYDDWRYLAREGRSLLVRRFGTVSKEGVWAFALAEAVVCAEGGETLHVVKKHLGKK